MNRPVYYCAKPKTTSTHAPASGDSINTAAAWEYTDYHYDDLGRSDVITDHPHTLAQQNVNGISYLSTDGHGSTRILLNSNCTVTHVLNFDALGK